MTTIVLPKLKISVSSAAKTKICDGLPCVQHAMKHFENCIHKILCLQLKNGSDGLVRKLSKSGYDWVGAEMPYADDKTWRLGATYNYINDYFKIYFGAKMISHHAKWNLINLTYDCGIHSL